MEKKKNEKPATQAQPQQPHELTKDQLGSITGGADIYTQVGSLSKKITQFVE